MKKLENKIPPPILMLLVAASMWGVSKVQPAIAIEPRLHSALTAALGAIAVLFGVGGIITFRLAKTTINPVQIDRASRVVSNGVYRITRNPMYVGLTGLLVTWSVFLAVPVTLLGPILFAMFTHRFQILPEERVMSAKFGNDYDEYRNRVRRWL
jgi:protein-S-isoprenylcysteine O-methyltransferase Ste14